ncbi:MAG: multiheme c-type cytochrome [Planctomycetota bacterium]|jgi:hypothetical protein
MMRGRRAVIVTAAFLVCLAAVWCKVVVYGADAPQAATYVGSKSCRSCHTKEYKTWRKTKHYKTFKQLEGPETKDPDCLKCHSTGYGKPGGFSSEEETPDLASTGCEACHGPCSEHNKAAKDAPEKGKWDTKIPKVVKTVCHRRSGSRSCGRSGRPRADRAPHGVKLSLSRTTVALDSPVEPAASRFLRPRPREQDRRSAQRAGGW